MALADARVDALKRMRSFDAPTIERVAIIVPILNEARHVEQLVEDIANQDFAGDLSVVVADGGSEDGSVALLRAAAARTRTSVTVLRNERRLASAGLNRCLEAVLPSRPDLVVRLDAHARYPRDYVRLCARAVEETSAWVVGGAFDPVGDTVTGRAVACALDSPFGGHNWTRHRRRSDRVEADTVFCGAFRPAAFDEVGGYDESVGVAEVEELNLRIRRAGGRVLHDPLIRPLCVVRGSFRQVFAQYYRYGLWKVAVIAKHGQVLSTRSLVPQAFVLSLVTLGPLARRHTAPRRLLAAEAALYAAGAVTFGAAAVRRRSESWRLLPRVLAVYPTLHVAHGLGGLHGWLRAAWRSAREPAADGGGDSVDR